MKCHKFARKKQQNKNIRKTSYDSFDEVNLDD